MAILVRFFPPYSSVIRQSLFCRSQSSGVRMSHKSLRFTMFCICRERSDSVLVIIRFNFSTKKKLETILFSFNLFKSTNISSGFTGWAYSRTCPQIASTFVGYVAGVFLDVTSFLLVELILFDFSFLGVLFKSSFSRIWKKVTFIVLPVSSSSILD